MFNTLFLNLVEFEEKLFRSFKSSDFYFLFVFKFENLGAKCFWNLLGLFMCISCHKNCLSVVFLQNFQSFSKIFTSSIDWSWSLTDRKCSICRSKLSAWFDCFSVVVQPIEIFQLTFSITTRFLTTDWNSKISNS